MTSRHHMDLRTRAMAVLAAGILAAGAGALQPAAPAGAASCITPITLTANMFGSRPYGVSAQPTINSAGDRIVFWSTADSALRTTNQDGSIELFMAVLDPLTGLSVQQVTTSTGSILGGFNLAPSLDGDGTRVAFFSDRNLAAQNPDGNFEVFVADVAPAGVTVSALTSTSVGINIFPAISRNGRYVAFTSDRKFDGNNPQGASQIVRADIAALSVTVAYSTVTDSPVGVNNEFASISGDGSRIAYVSDEANPGSGSTDIYLAEIGANGAIKHTRITYDGVNSQPAISADGTRVVWMNAPTPDGPSHIWSADLLTGLPITSPVSTQSAVANTQPAISDDSLRVAYVSRPLTPANASPRLLIYDYFADTFTDYGPVNDSTRVAIDGQGGRVSYVTGRDALAVGCAELISQGRAADLGVSLLVSGPLAIAGNQPVAGLPVTYTTLINNLGPLRSLGGVITTTYPQSTTFVRGSQGCNDLGGSVTCPVTVITKGASIAPFVVFDLAPGTPDTISNQINLFGRYDVTPTNNVLLAPDTARAVLRVADMAIDKSASVTEASLGDTIVYRINITNYGPSNAPAVVVTDVIPLGSAILAADQTDDDVSSTGFGGGTRDANLLGLSPARGLSRVVGRPLPDGHAAGGWLDMTNAALLLHFDESAGSVPSDTSGYGNTVACSPGCPTLGVSGVLSGAAAFNAGLAQSWALDVPNDAYNLTFMGWISASGGASTSQVLYATKSESCFGGFGSLGYEYGSALRLDYSPTGDPFLVVEYASPFSFSCQDVLATPQGALPRNKWVHVAMVQDGIGVALYVDGRLIASQSFAFPRNLQINWGPTIGSYALGNAWYSGWMDEVAVLDRSLSAAEIANVHATQFSRAAQFDSRMMTVDSPVARTSLSWDASRPRGKPLPDTGAEPAYPGGGQVNMAGLAWPVLHFDAQMAAQTGYPGPAGLNCFVGGCGVIVPNGRFGGALRMRGSSTTDSLWINPRPSGFGDGDFSMEAWISTTQDIATSSAGQWWSGAGLIDADVGGQYNDFGLGLVAGRPTFGVGIQFVQDVSIAGPYVADGRWHHIAATRSAGSSRIALYVDGQLVREAYPGQYAALNVSPLLAIGAYASNIAGAGSRYDGLIDEAALYNRELGVDEIRARYERGAVRLRFQVRGCPDATCVGVPFVGPDNTGSSYFADGPDVVRSDGRITATLNLAANPVFQYRALLDNLYPISAPDLGYVQIGPRVTGIRTSEGTCQDAAGVVTCAIPVMPLGATARITIPVVAATSDSASLTNRAQVAAAAIDDNLANNQSTAVVAANPVNLVILKSADRLTATAGSDITYTIQVSNVSALGATQVRMTDTLPAGLSIVDPIGGCNTAPGNLLVCALGSIPGNSASSNLVIHANISSTLRGQLVNRAAVSSNESESVLYDNTSVVTTALVSNAVLTLTQSAQDIVAGRTATFTIVMTNVGPSSARNTVVSGILSATGQYTLSAAPQTSQGFCLTPQANMNFTCSLGETPVGRRVLITVTAAVSQDAVGVFTSTVTAVSADTANAVSAELVAPIGGLIAFDVDVASRSPFAVAGLPITHTVTFTNVGPSRATLVVVTDTLPASVTALAVTDKSSALSCTVGTAIVCDRSQMRVDVVSFVEIRGVVDPAAVGTLVNTAVVRARGMSADATASLGIPIVSISDVSTNLTVDPAAVDAGRVVTYAASVANDGPSTSLRTVMTLTLPTSATVDAVFALSSPLTFARSANQVVFTATSHDPGITLGASLRVTVSASTDPGSAVATLVAGTTSSDVQPSNNAASAAVTVTDRVNLSVALDAEPGAVDAGAAQLYTLTLANAGPSTARQPAMTLTLPVDTAFGSLVSASPSLNLDNLGDRLVFSATSQRPDEILSAVVRLVLAPDAQPGPIVAGLAATAASVEADLADNTAAVTSTVTASADLSATLGASASSVDAGGAIQFQLAMVNRGPSAAMGTVMTFIVPVSATVMGQPTWAAALTHAAIGDTLTWSAPQQLPGQPLTATVMLLVDPGALASTLVTQLDVASGTSDPQTANNTAALSTAVTTSADLSVTLSSPSTGVNPGGQIQYVMSVTNLGPSIARSPALTVTLPPSLTAFTLIGATPGFDMSGAGGQRVWNDTLQLPGEVLTASFSITVSKVSPPLALVLGAVSGASTSDPVAQNSRAALTTTLTYVGLSGVTLTGPTAATAGSTNSFLATAAPVEATWPITYSWRTSRNGTVTEHVVNADSDPFDINFGAAVTGTFQVTVTARAPAGSTRTDAMSIVISP